MIIDCPTILPGKIVPEAHTKDGGNASPELKWDDVPDGTVTFALICEDPDAPRGTFGHWVVFDIPGDMRHLDPRLPRVANLKNGSKQGRNDFGEVGYDGPRPPRGDRPHTYVFQLFALDRKLDLDPAVTSREQLMLAIRGHVLEHVVLSAVYARPVTA